MLINDRFNGVYASINAEGIVSVTVPEGTSGAVYKEYELRDGTKGSKWVKEYNKIAGFITNVKFIDGKFGEQVNVHFKDEEGEIILTLSIKSNYASDLLKKLPNVNFSKKLILAPYSFKDDKNKLKKGVTLYQDDVKIPSFFNDADGKSINDFPAPQKKYEEMKTNDWTVYFIQVSEFLKNYTETMVLEKIEGALAFNTIVKDDVEEELSTDDIPFDNVEPTVE